MIYEYKEYEIKSKSGTEAITSVKYEIFWGAVTWKMLFSGDDKILVRGSLQGGTRWELGMSKIIFKNCFHEKILP